MQEIHLIGKKQDLINIIESHIAYLLASGYDDSDELNTCYNFLMQFDETNKFLIENEI